MVNGNTSFSSLSHTSYYDTFAFSHFIQALSSAECTMGLSASKLAGDKVCIDCDRKTQKVLPSDDSSSASKGMPCEEIYARVGKAK